MTDSQKDEGEGEGETFTSGDSCPTCKDAPQSTIWVGLVTLGCSASSLVKALNKLEGSDVSGVLT